MGMWTQTDRDIHRETGKRYPSDLSDEEWALTVPFFAEYRPLSTTIREIVEACLYLVAEGCRWRALPRDFPPWQTVRWWWDRFRREGVWQAAARALTPAARAAAGRSAEPRTGLVDTQSVRCGPQKGDRGWDGGKKLNGRKRHALTCSAGFLLAVLVTAACLLLDGAGWHVSEGLTVPANLTLIHPPPYSPELNPVERVWEYLRDRWLSHRVLAGGYEAVVDAACAAWNALLAEPGRLRSLTNFPWLPPAVSTS